VLLAIGDDDYYTIEGTGLERNLPTSELSAAVERVSGAGFCREGLLGGQHPVF
jgi:hypothetical protein